MTASIRRAAAGDAAALAELGSSTFIETFGHLYAPEDLNSFLSQAHSIAKYRHLLAETDTALWIASDEHAQPLAYGLAGKCQLPVPQREPTAGEVRRLYVSAAAQKQQLGSRLLTEMLDWLAGAGQLPVYVGVWSENLGAQRLYLRFGFEKVGEYDFPVGRHIDREFILRRK